MYDTTDMPSLHFFLFVSRPFLYGFFYTVLNVLQYFNSNVQMIDITRIMIREIFQPSRNIYFGSNPYPTGIARIDVGSI